MMEQQLHSLLGLTPASGGVTAGTPLFDPINVFRAEDLEQQVPIKLDEAVTAEASAVESPEHKSEAKKPTGAAKAAIAEGAASSSSKQDRGKRKGAGKLRMSSELAKDVTLAVENL